MSHHHDHDHGHSHDHDHSNTHSHEHDHAHEMSLEEKLQTLLKHWIDHNNSHMETYRSWAQKAEEGTLEKVGALLKQTADTSADITKTLEAALKQLS